MRCFLDLAGGFFGAAFLVALARLLVAALLEAFLGDGLFVPTSEDSEESIDDDLLSLSRSKRPNSISSSDSSIDTVFAGSSIVALVALGGAFFAAGFRARAPAVLFLTAFTSGTKSISSSEASSSLFHSPFFFLATRFLGAAFFFDFTAWRLAVFSCAFISSSSASCIFLSRSSSATSMASRSFNQISLGSVASNSSSSAVLSASCLRSSSTFSYVKFHSFIPNKYS
mmetsp:Transcript_9573/g.20711  ORF Transcript_9573/g.20711 Transcript_9573/m.20711 type:complete len:227 (-) Transcript_9573:3654-4334(-)